MEPLRCDECGFDYGAVPAASAAGRLRAAAKVFRSVLAGGDATVRQRPAPDVWSPLEYACHVRDVLLVQRERLLLTLHVPSPTFVPMFRDERAVTDRDAPEAAFGLLAGARTGSAGASGPQRCGGFAAKDQYAEQAPVDVARQLDDAAAMFTFVLDGLTGEQWARTCTYNYPAPEERTVAWLAVHTVHEVEHHLADASG